IIRQHLQSPAMWCVFLLQDILAIDHDIRRTNPTEERINNPADPEHVWDYRLHITLEQLLKEKKFINLLKKMVKESGRA
ncbi:MAG: 4-alpha-glucanotransferase, partial [Ferruginibacter sp.]